MSLHPEHSENASEYRLEELRILKKEIENAIGETRLIERYALVACGGIWAWLAGNPPTASEEPAIWWLPVLIALLGGMRAAGLVHEVRITGSYLLELEQKYLGKPGGWEAYLRSQRRYGVAANGAVYWATLVVVAVGLALLRG